jgi:3-isopropylmalate/(R)-2-methylmalate dehydratase large subunit
MHCTTFGSIGALALGIGPEVTSVLACGTVWTQTPETIQINLHGALAEGCHPRDAGFIVAHGLASGAWGVEYDNCVVEFAGEGAARLNVAERVALCNSVTEIGVASVLFDGMVASDAQAHFRARLDLDLSQVAPHVALPGGPERAAQLHDVLGRTIQHAALGSCGSGMYEDYVGAARLLQGKKIAAGVRLFVTPGSVNTAQRLAADGVMAAFMEAGAVVLPAGCGPCANGLMAPVGASETSISTAAANHKGRLGAGEAYLASPLTVAASALAGCIADPRGLFGHG